MTVEKFFHFLGTDHASSVQRDLSTRVKCIDDPNFSPRFLCGIDAAYEGDSAFVGAAVWDLSNARIVETVAAADSVTIKYIPGFLGFREGPLLVRAAEKLRQQPDVFLVDGQGIAHPRRFGLACHVGLFMDKPTVGVAKSRLYGISDGSKILDPEGKVIGRVLTSRNQKFYVSVGHRISLETASNLVERCIVNGHPTPLRRAHLESFRARNGESD